MVTIWHNPRCTKSRNALKYLEQNKTDITVFEYLKEPIAKTDIENIINFLEIDDAREMLRKKEPEYKQYNLNDTNLSQNQVLDIVIKNPKLIERPIIIKGNKAVIARDNIEKLLANF